MLCKKPFCGAKVRPFYEVAKDFNKNNQKLRSYHMARPQAYILYIRCIPVLADYRLGFSLVQSSTAGMIPRAMISSRILPRCSTEEAKAAISSAVPSGAT